MGIWKSIYVGWAMHLEYEVWEKIRYEPIQHKAYRNLSLDLASLNVRYWTVIYTHQASCEGFIHCYHSWVINFPDAAREEYSYFVHVNIACNSRVCFAIFWGPFTLMD